MSARERRSRETLKRFVGENLKTIRNGMNPNAPEHFSPPTKDHGLNLCSTGPSAETVEEDIVHAVARLESTLRSLEALVESWDRSSHPREPARRQAQISTLSPTHGERENIINESMKEWHNRRRGDGQGPRVYFCHEGTRFSVGREHVSSDQQSSRMVWRRPPTNGQIRVPQFYGQGRSRPVYARTPHYRSPRGLCAYCGSNNCNSSNLQCFNKAYRY